MKNPRKSLIKRLDEAFATEVKKRARKEFDGKCPFCGIRDIEHCFHFVTRAKYKIRWDFRNATGSCAACNYQNEFDPAPFMLWYTRKYGLAEFEKLVKDGNGISKFSNSDLEEMLKEIRGMNADSK